MTTIPADCFMMFIVGMLFSVSGSSQIERSGRPYRNRHLFFALLFQTIFCMPVSIYCYLVFPDWCWMYWLDADKVPPLMVAAGFMFYYVMLLGGFITGFHLEKSRRGRGITGLGYGLVALALFVIFTWKRLLVVVSLEEFQAGQFIYLHQRSPLFAIVTGGIIVAFAVMIAILARLGKGLDYRPSAEEVSDFIGMERNVSIVRLDKGVREAIERSLSDWNGMEYMEGKLRQGDYNVLIKINLAGGARERKGTQTSLEAILSTVEIIRSIASNASIRVVESPSIVWRDLDLLIKGGIYEGALMDKGIELADLSKEEKVPFDFGGRLGKEYIPSILKQNNVLIDLPVAKTHAFFGMSGALKNMFGLLPHPNKLLRYHTKGFADHEGRIFLDIYRNFPPDLIIIDGTISGEGPCPVAGRGRRTGFIITSDDAFSADIALAGIMGIEADNIPYLRAAVSDGYRPLYRLTNTGGLKFDAFRLKKVRLRLLTLLLNGIWIIRENIIARRKTRG